MRQQFDVGCENNGAKEDITVCQHAANNKSVERKKTDSVEECRILEYQKENGILEYQIFEYQNT